MTTEVDSNRNEIDRGLPGAYAQARFDRERRREQLKLRAALPLVVAAAVITMTAVFLALQFAGPAVAGIAAVITGVAFAGAMYRLPMDSVFWLKGAKGELGTADALASLEPRGYIVIYGRLVPGRNKDIDAFVVGPAGVFIVETKNWKGRTQVRNHRLWVGESDRTGTVEQIYEQAVAVQIALSEVLNRTGVSVTPVLSLAGGMARLSVEKIAAGVEVVDQKDVAELISHRKQLLDEETVREIALAAHRRLPRPRAATIVAQSNADATKSGSRTPTAAAAVSPAHPGDFERLRAWRLKRSRSDGVAAFVIFSDETLRAIAGARPRTAAELLAVKGVGQSKLDSYGHDVLSVFSDTDSSLAQ